MPAVETHALSKRYENGIDGLIDLDLSVEASEIFGFLGPNGAGKTTTIRLLNGTLSPTGGSARVLGIESRTEDIRAKTSTLGELANMYESMTVYENLMFFAAMYDLQKRDAELRIKELLEKMQLWDKHDLKLGSFSTGMKKRVQLIRVLLHRPELIFLDEPTSGLDPDSSAQVTDLIRTLAKESGTTIFLCTHNLPLAERICDSFGFLSKGSLVIAGQKEQIIRSIVKEPKVTIRTTEGEQSFAYRQETDINRRIREVMDEGKTILDVYRERPTLEDAYFHYIGRDEHGMA